MTADQYTNQELFLDVGDGHRVYIHDWGNPEAAIPILYLHGGPGNGCDDSDKTKFDPTSQRVIFHDQRGAGKSTPTGSLENNTSQCLVADITKILDHLRIDQAILTGGSWGSTLALLYGIAEPTRVKGMIIDGVFTATQAEEDWLEDGGWRTFFPEVWEAYSTTVPVEHRERPSAYHFEKALGADETAAKQSAYAYLSMELALLKLDDTIKPTPFDDFDPAAARIEIHYLHNKCFIEENYILNNAAKLPMPIYILQGKYDMVCPPITAHNLHRALPKSNLIWTINGHLKQHEAKNILQLLVGQFNGAN